MLTRLACVVGVVLLWGCECGPAGEDGGLIDAGALDAGLADAGVIDGGVVDVDAGPADAGLADAGADDAGVTDAGMTDAGMTDAGMTDAGVTDAGATDAGVTDAGVTDAGLPDAGPLDAGTCVDFGCTSGLCCSAACVDTSTSLDHCGGCDVPCSGQGMNTVATCTMGTCERTCAAGFFDCDLRADNGCETGTSCVCMPGSTQSCYSGAPGTAGVGLCASGTRTCAASGLSYGPCLGEVVPVAEVCSDFLDNDCDGSRDESIDEDGDGYTVCDGDCCDGPSCPNNVSIGPGSFEIAGNQVDDDCDGTVDGAPLTCDATLASDSLDANDAVRAMGLCRFRSGPSARGWGVVSASYVRSSGSNTPAATSHALRTSFGTNNLPLEGSRLLVLSTGHAAPAGAADGDPAQSTNHGLTSTVPADWLAANGGQVPRGTCPVIAGGSVTYDPVMLQLTVRVPQNARSFSLRAHSLSSDYAEFVCSPYLDQFVVLLDSQFSPQAVNDPQAPPNPSHKNLAVSSSDLTTPLRTRFTQCVNGPVGCGTGGFGSSYGACTSTMGLIGTGYDTPQAGQCDANALRGGGTGWLTISGNVISGEQIVLRIAVWDSGDGTSDSTVLLDQFQWSTTYVQPGG